MQLRFLDFNGVHSGVFVIMLTKKKFNVATQRPVLILDFNNDFSNFEAKLTPLDWIPTIVSTVSQSIRIISEPDLKIAIAVVSSDKHRQTFNAVVKLQHLAPKVKWLAILMQYPILSLACTKKLSAHFVDYFHCPIDWELLLHSLGHVWGMEKLHDEANQGRHHTQNHIIVGRSKVIKNLKLKLARIAQTDCPVLISGETGTGKGLCSQLIHSLSHRRDGPLVTVNCGALPSTLIHSELFGHEKGAYTGAETQYIGYIERADNGTLFLDEIGDLPLELQVHLLRFVDENIIERLGGDRPIKVDCRIIFASHIDLETAVAEGEFREDLYHRLNILRLHVPSLREYREDIEVLADDYLARFNHRDHKLHLSNSALQTMLQYDWPGNVRELKNRILRAVVMAESDQITEKELGIKLIATAGLENQRIELDTEVLLEALKLNNHNVSAASRHLNISRTTFYRLIKKCNIKW